MGRGIKLYNAIPRAIFTTYRNGETLGIRRVDFLTPGEIFLEVPIVKMPTSETTTPNMRAGGFPAM